MKRINWLFILPFMAVIGLTVSAPRASAAPAETSEIQTCAKCHDDEVETFQKSHHAKAWATRPELKVSCNSCHGDGTQHVKTKGDAPVPIVYAGANVTVEKAAEACLSCHNQNGNLAFWSAGKHGKSDMACGTCHNLHSYDSVKPSPNVCFGCHKDIKHDAMKLSHHPIIEGKVSCNDCHNPHGTLNHGMLRAESINQLCYKCHADKRGPFLWEHAPVEENCMTCHNSHGSRNPKLLVEKTPNLCQNCHDAASHPGKPYQGSGGFGAGTGTAIQMVGRACLNCHNKIHGSFAPGAAGMSGKRFIR